MVRLITYFLSILATNNAWPSETYEPIQADPFDEPWRWTQFEFLNDYAVHDMDEAPDGTLWFATDHGLLSYDGLQATSHSFVNETLQGQSAKTIYVARDGAVYVLTDSHGAAYRDGQWTLLFESPMNGARGRCIDESANGDIWFGTHTGLYRLNKHEIEFIETPIDSYSSVLVDKTNQLWLSSSLNGQAIRLELNQNSGLPSRTTQIVPPKKFWRNHSFVDFIERSDGNIWILSNSRSGAIQQYDGSEQKTILSNWKATALGGIRSVAKGPDGRLWLTTQRSIAVFHNGIGEKKISAKLPIPESRPFIRFYGKSKMCIGGNMDKTYSVDLSEERWKSYPDLNFQCQDRFGRNWFISENKRIVRHDPVTDTWKAFSPLDGIISHSNSIISTRDGRVWASGSHQGNAAIAWYENERWTRDEHPSLGSMIGHLSPYESRDGAIYFAQGKNSTTLKGDHGGLIRYRKENGTYQYKYLTPPHYPERATSIAQQENGDLWFGGMWLKKKKEGSPFELEKRFGETWIDDIALGADNQFWAAIWGGGVFSHSEEEGWKRFPELDDMIGRRSISLLVGRKLTGIWVATSDGISRYDGETWNAFPIKFDALLQREGARLLESPEGSLWITSASRSWNFNRNNTPNAGASPFRSIRYKPDQEGPQTQLLAFETKLHESNNAQFKWTASDAWQQTPSQQIEYSYRINETGWSPYRTISKTLLPSMEPGKYTFEVRARDSDWNVDPTPAIAHFTVIPFLWKRPWFIASAFLLISTTAILATLLVHTRIKHVLEIEEIKLQFFSNISHELRTHLSIILGPLQSLSAKNIGGKENALITMALRNANKMHCLFNQLLEFRKVEIGQLQYHPSRTDIILFIKDAVYSHATHWEEKNQHFTLQLSHQNESACFDPEKLQSIIDNLLSNAIKYTPENGEIDMSVEIFHAPNSQEKILEITVSDNGIGIAPKDQVTIFRPFHRLQDDQRKYKGIGLGLSYTKEIIEIWKGQIHYQSPIHETDPINKGTRFTVTLPLREEPDATTFDNPSYNNEALEVVEENPQQKNDSKKANLLIIEDNPDLRVFLKGELRNSYDILEAEDGLQGLKTATQEMPDLIISDIMMPEMDGLDLCSRLKTQEETSHIPIIILTARNSEKFHLKGIENGADEYFQKPINITLLQTRAQKLLESRRKLRERFSKQVILQPREIAVTPTDESFLQRSIRIVEDSLQEEDFDVHKFSKKIGMSRSSLYNKIKAVSDRSPSEFIRDIRLKRAAQLLRTGEVTVSETLQQVGVSDMSYFGKIFRKEFGKSPSEYRKG